MSSEDVLKIVNLKHAWEFIYAVKVQSQSFNILILLHFEKI